MTVCTCAAEGIEDLGPGIPPSAYPALLAQCRRHGVLAYERDGVRLFTGHVLDVLAELPADSVDCCVTSPPYWSLRKYEGPTDTIWGGDPACCHDWTAGAKAEGFTSQKRWQHSVNGQGNSTSPSAERGREAWVHARGRDDDPGAWGDIQQGETCALCGAWRGQLGLEPTVEAFIEHLMEVMAAIRRVLKPTGVCFINLCDSYSSQGGSGAGASAARMGRA